MAGRKLNTLEQRLHQSALADAKKTLNQKEVEELAPDVTVRTAAINFLLGTGLFRLMKDAKGAISFRAVAKNELDVKKDLAGEENMVLSHIQTAGNEGIWTKHLKAKTELHQTVIDRALKSLVQRQLVKSVKSVKHPTRKIYMLFHLDPSVDITGGPWYTDNELDTEFIKLLSSACLRFVRDRSFPKVKSDVHPMFPISASTSYPTAQQIQTFLSKSKITETQLSVEHIEMLLNVLVTDGEIEKVPAFGASLWDANAPDSETEGKGKKHKHAGGRGEDKRKRRRGADEGSCTEDDSDGITSQGQSRQVKRPKKLLGESEGEVASEDDENRTNGRGRKRRAVNDVATNREDEVVSTKKKGKTKRRRSPSSSESRPDSSDSESKSVNERSRKKKRSRKQSSSPVAHNYDLSAAFTDDYGGAFVYRAIRQERVVLGWSQAPCGRCPQFDFCSDKGPVNPRECEYYGEWLGAAALKVE